MGSGGANRLNLSNKRFGRLIALSAGRTKSGKTAWFCLCDCGTEKLVPTISLTTGDAKSCGCLRDELTAKRASELNKTHGMSGSREMNSYKGMMDRCYRKRHHAYPRYGGRGISVCERWHKFENFLADMGPRPKGMTLDRIDSNGNYELGNCRWADWKTQGANKRSTRLIKVGEDVNSISGWARLRKIPIKTLWNRIDRGWPTEFLLSKENYRNNSPLKAMKGVK